MLGYLFAYLVAPWLRRLVTTAVVLALGAHLVTLPARLWVRYVSPHPAPVVVVGLNAATAVATLALAARHRTVCSRRRTWRESARWGRGR